MNKSRHRKHPALVLTKEVIARLTDEQLRRAGGGDDIERQSGLSFCRPCSTV